MGGWADGFLGFRVAPAATTDNLKQHGTADSTRALRFRILDPGPWILDHCAPMSRMATVDNDDGGEEMEMPPPTRFRHGTQ